MTAARILAGLASLGATCAPSAGDRLRWWCPSDADAGKVNTIVSTNKPALLAELLPDPLAPFDVLLGQACERIRTFWQAGARFPHPRYETAIERGAAAGDRDAFLGATADWLLCHWAAVVDLAPCPHVRDPRLIRWHRDLPDGAVCGRCFVLLDGTRRAADPAPTDTPPAAPHQLHMTNVPNRG
ncbi:hypothetical protein L6Q96_16125 [Candidatus Binatia bacterium]|nr:hypothetical protein [Candidatus Binatia bacterium]